ncbi:DegT/DnrJ/EryC1/StrS family aminotransferase [Kamptonema formosum]|uniref:DegT/DnrJ/EryC1/StrS family aminotransferase n=1 Tax=Kamptonema formosum TaxID=331992 RepID=UPI000345946B|nr:DegT/DnrJ/EryC1/StrS family aminotransferase [Oscillatoria sp. PCC 10802]
MLDSTSTESSRTSESSKLAINGGTPVCQKPWPTWPQSNSATEKAVIDVLRSGRWTISGFTNGQLAQEQMFAAAFADFVGVKNCIPTDHGTSALELALAASGVGSGDEVIVPGLTWVACPYAVLAQQAVPVLADVDPYTMCIAPESVRRLLTSRTKAVLVVHLYCRIADMAALNRIATEHDLVLIEDCAQAHGARWRGRCVGSIGKVGAFSMQQGKPLTSGEGGCCVTDDDELADLIYRLRTDGRSFLPDVQALGKMQLWERGGVAGRNHCLSDIQLAILTAQLKDLPAQNVRRRENAAYLTKLLGQIPGVSIPNFHDPDDEETYYHFAFFLNEEFLRGRSLAWVSEALSAELGVWIHQPYVPLNRHPLYVPEEKHWVKQCAEARQAVCKERFTLPHAEEVYGKTLLLHHSILLAERKDMDLIAAALKKVHKEMK